MEITLSTFWGSFFISFLFCFLLLPTLLGIMRLFGLYVIVNEMEAKVYTLFGKVVGIIDKPGLHCLWLKLTWRGPIINFIGSCHTIDLRTDQTYLRSQQVNSEEGAPMGVGVWYEMYIDDPVAYLFKNVDPRGSLAANVSNSTVRTLSNLPLSELLVDRHRMSSIVRNDVSQKSQEWGYKLGSVYIRKVHFRDHQMIKQIEEKVVNRLRQVTSAINQDGENKVSIIKSTAEKEAAIEFAKASATRPQIVGEALKSISDKPTLLNALFKVLETQRLLESDCEVAIASSGLGQLVNIFSQNQGTGKAIK